MIPKLRHAFNRAFSEERYGAFVDALTRRCGVPIEFRLSETPCFFPQALIEDLETAAQEMIEQLLAGTTGTTGSTGSAGTTGSYRLAADEIVPPRFRIPNGEVFPTFIQVDFGLVRVGDRTEGRLVELQAFPSLYGFQVALAETARDVWGLE